MTNFVAATTTTTTTVAVYNLSAPPKVERDAEGFFVSSSLEIVERVSAKSLTYFF